MQLDHAKLLGIVLLVAIGCLTVIPVFYVVITSFDVASFGEPARFDVSAWRNVFTSPKTIQSIGNSFLLSIRIPIALAIALPIAWLLIRANVPASRFIQRSLWFGFFLPTIPLTMGWILLLDKNYGLFNLAAEKLPFVTGPLFSIYSIPGIIWVHLTATTVPMMVILLSPALRQLDSAFEEAAEMSGTKAIEMLWCITIPLIAPAIITSFIAGFIRSLEVFEVEQLLGTPANIQVYATRIYDLVSAQPPLYPEAMALSALFLIILLTIALFYQAYLTRAGTRATMTGKSARLQPRARRWWAKLVSAFLIAYIAVTIFLPLLILVLGSLTKLFGFFFLPHPWTLGYWIDVLTAPDFLHAATNSVVLGLVVGGIGTAFYSIAAWALVRTRVWGRSLLALLIWLPWAIPGLVLGITLLSLMLNLPVIGAIYGTIIPLGIAMIIKDMPIGVQMLRAAIGQIAPELDEAAAMSGARQLTVFLRVTLPLIMPMLVTVFLLVSMATLREISTLVLLASPGTRTLSLVMFDYATTGHFESAAVIGVLIAVISLIITSIAFRISARVGMEL